MNIGRLLGRAICAVAVLGWASTAAAQSLAYVVSVTTSSPPQVELHVINTATSHRTMVFTIAPYVASPAPNVPMTPQVLISPDRRTAFVTAGDLFVVDILTGVVQATSLGTTLGPMALNAAGSLLYVADQGGKRIVVMDTSTRQLTGSAITLATMPSRLGLSADGATLVVLAHASERVAYVVNTASRAVTTTIATREVPVEIAVHPDGSRVFVGHSTASGLFIGADTLVAYDTTSGAATATLNLPDFSGQVGQFAQGSRLYEMALLPSGAKLYIPRFRGGWRTSPTAFSRTEEVVVVETAGLTVTSRLNVPITSSDPSFGMGTAALADGSRVVFASAGASGTIDPATDTLTAGGPSTTSPTWVATANAPPCWAEASPQRVIARNAGATVEIPLALGEGCAWTATKSGDFFTVSPLSGSGPSTLTVQVPAGTDPQLGSLSVLGQTVQVERTNPQVALDSPLNGAELTLPFDVTGWAIERRVTPSPSYPMGISGALLYDQPGSSSSTFFRVLLYPRHRPDVGAVFGAPYEFSGFFSTVGRLSAGVHTLTIHPRSAMDSTLLTPASATITVVRQPRVELDSPSNNATVTQPFKLVGWAADMTVPSGTGVDAVHVWAQPTAGGAAVFVGAATLGISRADVGGYFNEQPLLAGFERTVTGLAPGRYTLTAYAHYTATGTFEATASREFLVDPVTLAATPSSLTFGVSPVARTGAQLVRVTMTGPSAGQVAWSASLVDANGILELRTAAGVVGPVSGTGAGSFQVALKPGTNLSGISGTVAAVRLSSSGAMNAPVDIPVTIRQVSPMAPDGFFDTPSDGANVSGTIAVTGWAVDDVEVTRLAVYRNGTGSEPSLVFIGDASFVEGARPDVAALFPNHPRHTRAGWGLSVLTNMLPNQGNGTFVLHAYAYDGDGLSTLLGTKTITGNNATATLPFGTIDVPSEGATVSGNLVMFGWALTPSPGIIPVDGSTIEVLVDGVMAGRPTYNQCRGTNGTNFPPPGTCNDDIATIFGTSYRNISEGSGAIGSFVLDTTTLTNGLHLIQWRVTDSLNRVQGIGSRYIYVQN